MTECINLAAGQTGHGVSNSLVVALLGSKNDVLDDLWEVRRSINHWVGSSYSDGLVRSHFWLLCNNWVIPKWHEMWPKTSLEMPNMLLDLESRPEIAQSVLKYRSLFRTINWAQRAKITENNSSASWNLRWCGKKAKNQQNDLRSRKVDLSPLIDWQRYSEQQFAYRICSKWLFKIKNRQHILRLGPGAHSRSLREGWISQKKKIWLGG